MINPEGMFTKGSTATVIVVAAALKGIVVASIGLSFFAKAIIHKNIA